MTPQAQLREGMAVEGEMAVQQETADQEWTVSQLYNHLSSQADKGVMRSPPMYAELNQVIF